MYENVHDRAGIYLVTAPHLLGVYRPAHAGAPLEYGNVVARFGEIARADQGVVTRTYNSDSLVLHLPASDTEKGGENPPFRLLEYYTGFFVRSPSRWGQTEAANNNY